MRVGREGLMRGKTEEVNETEKVLKEGEYGGRRHDE